MIFSLAVVGLWDSSSTLYVLRTVLCGIERFEPGPGGNGSQQVSVSVSLQLSLAQGDFSTLSTTLFHLFPLSSALAPPFYPLPFSLLPDACACACAYAHGGGCPLTYRGTGVALL